MTTSNKDRITGSVNVETGISGTVTTKAGISGTLTDSFVRTGDKTYVHTQATASAEWTITHSLGKYPAVSVVDSAGNVVVGEVTYIDVNALIVCFTAIFSGKAFCN